MLLQRALCSTALFLSVFFVPLAICTASRSAIPGSSLEDPYLHRPSQLHTRATIAAIAEFKTFVHNNKPAYDIGMTLPPAWKNFCLPGVVDLLTATCAAEGLITRSLPPWIDAHGDCIVLLRSVKLLVDARSAKEILQCYIEGLQAVSCGDPALLAQLPDEFVSIIALYSGCHRVYLTEPDGKSRF